MVLNLINVQPATRGITMNQNLNVWLVQQFASLVLIWIIAHHVILIELVRIVTVLLMKGFPMYSQIGVELAN